MNKETLTFNFDVVKMTVKSPEGVLLEMKMSPNPSMPIEIDAANYQLVLEAISVMGSIYRHTTDTRSRVQAQAFLSKAVNAVEPDKEV